MAFNVSYTFQALDNFSAVSNKINSTLSSLSNKLTTVKNKFKATGAALTSTGRQMSLAITAPLAGIGFAAIKASDDLDEFRNRLDAAGMSVTKTNKVYRNLINFTVKSPFDFTGTSRAAETLVRMGDSSKVLMSHMKMLGNLTAATGGDMNMFAGMLGRAEASSRGVSLFFNTLGQYGINVKKELSRMAAAAGHAGINIDKAVAGGAVTFRVLVQALKNMTTGSGALAGQMGKLGMTFSALAGSFKFAVQAYILKPLGDILIKTFDLNGLFVKMINFLIAKQDRIKLFIKVHKDLIKMWITIAAIAAALGPILLILGLIATSVSALMTPWMLIVGVVAAYVVSITKSYLKTHTFAQLLIAVGAKIQHLIARVKSLWNIYGGLITFLIKGIAIILGLAKAIQVVLVVVDLLSGPIGWIALAVTGIVALATYLYKKFALVRDIVKLIGMAFMWIIKTVGGLFYITFIEPFMKIYHAFKWLKGMFSSGAKNINVYHQAVTAGAALGGDQISSLTGSPQKVNSHLQISVNDPGGIIKKFQGDSTGSMGVNLGANMRQSKWNN